MVGTLGSVSTGLSSTQENTASLSLTRAPPGSALSHTLSALSRTLKIDFDGCHNKASLTQSERILCNKIREGVKKNCEKAVRLTTLGGGGGVITPA